MVHLQVVLLVLVAVIKVSATDGMIDPDTIFIKYAKTGTNNTTRISEVKL